MQRTRLALFVFIDSLGWQILQRHGFLEDEWAARTPVETVFGYSSTCIPTILTGCQPREHGHFSSFYYDPEGSPFGMCRALGVLPEFLTSRGRVRGAVSKLLARWHGWDGYFQLYKLPFGLLPYFDYGEKRDLQQPGGILGGQPTLFDHLREEAIPYHTNDWRGSEEQHLAALRQKLERRELGFAFLYLAALDGVIHQHGPESEQVGQKLRAYEAQLRQLLEVARRHYGEVRLYAVSDHGQAAVTHAVDLMRRVESLGLRFGRDYAAVWDSTMARFWFLAADARERITQALAEEPLGAWVSPQQLEAWGCDFPGDRYGEAFFLMQPGAVIDPSFMGGRVAGMHGYDPGHRDSTAMLAASTEPGRLPRRLDELHDFMLAEARWAESG